jgi:hypothetical protein
MTAARRLSLAPEDAFKVFDELSQMQTAATKSRSNSWRRRNDNHKILNAILS